MVSTKSRLTFGLKLKKGFYTSNFINGGIETHKLDVKNNDIWVVLQDGSRIEIELDDFVVRVRSLDYGLVILPGASNAIEVRSEKW